MKNFFTEFLGLFKPRLKTVLFLFAASAGLGVITAFFMPELMDEILASFAERFGEDPALDYNLAWEIFRQNATVSVIAWLGGLAFAIPSVFIVLTNGFILGYVVAYLGMATTSIGESLIVVAAGLLPHAIFELPAFLAAAALGLALGLNWLSPESKGHRLNILKQSFKSTSKYFLMIIILLAVAAWIEVFISGQLLEKIS